MYDIGAGAGRLYEAAVRAGYAYSACDVSAALVARFRTMHPGADIHWTDGRSLPWRTGSGDVGLLTYHVLEAIIGRRNRLRTLLEVRRVLRQGAVLYVSHHVAMRYRPRQQLRSFFGGLGLEEYGDISITGSSGAGDHALSSYRTHIISALECGWLARVSGFAVQDRWPFDASSERSARCAIMERWSAV
ncbi:methyltransferase domain-containing protein [Kribbella sp. CA-253562]|uniref:methyltransferase domain-containing protein n=1 Tax=Kribbella sp. CA-253562 TaxID=3239942 RepID=UPI003D8F3BDA